MAKYLIDANLPRHISVWSAADCEFVVDRDATWQDIKIWDYAHANTLTIVTKDADFADLVLLRADGPSVIHVRVGNMKFRDLDRFLSTHWADICLMSATSRLIQVFAGRIEAVS